MLEKLRYRILSRSINQFIAEKNGCKMPDFEKLSSIIVILEDLDKESVRALEDRFKSVFGINRIRFQAYQNSMLRMMVIPLNQCQVMI